MNLKNLLLSFLPWIVFSVVVHRAGAAVAGIAALLAVAVSLAMVLRDSTRGGIKTIDATGVLLFGALAVYAFVGGPEAASWVADYGRAAAAVVVGIVMLGSSVFVPFSEQYARESVPQEFWASPRFRAVNRKISALWGGIMVVMSTCHFLAGYLDPAGSVADGTVNATGPANIVLNWLVPAGLVVLGYRVTKSVSASASRSAGTNRSTTPVGR